MAGTKLSNLNPVTDLQSTDDLLIARNGSSYRVQTGRFFEALTGVKLAQNATANGIPVYKETINIDNGTRLMFHSLSADTGITATLAGDVIKFTIANNAIDTNKIINGAVDANKLASNAVTTAKVLNGAITPVKMSGSLYSVSTKTDVQTIPGNQTVRITGLSATVTPPTTQSVVLVNGYISIGGIYTAFNLIRQIGGSSVIVAQGNTSAGMSLATYSVGRAYGDYNATTCPLNFIDTPNTTQPVTYAIEVESLWSYVSFVNRGYNEHKARYSSRVTSQLGAFVLP